jgi:NADH dehydrogenase
MNIPNTDKQRIVIVGGGFGGLQLAKELKDKNFQVVLIDKHNYHAFQPLFYQVATADWSQATLPIPCEKYLIPIRNIISAWRNYKRLFLQQISLKPI